MGKRLIPVNHYEDIQNLYLNKKMSILEIAKLYNRSMGGIYYILKKTKTPMRSVQEGNQLKWINKDFYSNQVSKKKGKPSGALGKRWSIKHIARRPNIRGKNNPAWKGGRTTLAQSIKTLPEYSLWRNQIFGRDNWTCVICNRKRKAGDRVILHVDHIYPFSRILDDYKIKTVGEAISCGELWNIKNGRTLCKECHKKTDTWGMNQYTKSTNYLGSQGK